MTVAVPTPVSVETTNPKRPNNMGFAVGRLELLGRTTPKEQAYRADMQQIREQYGSVTNYVLTVAMSAGTVPDPVVKELFERRLDELHGTAGRESLWFVNPPALQSIPEVVHGHLIRQDALEHE
ncbi:hypothetical protein DL89DRAFT_264380 [Linderina pennispora]|uniref:Uncharacterized protein n=1 Tax=Linderina pennispora TaxID=61395 RepID=A0A1Y1WLU0_9FUNG|nr:uncharacterized protein DL89DRAFT_264380 [Linderina pennispora]ORX74529.1 hypothetical protein DL89DRAFT_264380 [Linderina pennispora]